MQKVSRDEHWDLSSNAEAYKAKEGHFGKQLRLLIWQRQGIEYCDSSCLPILQTKQIRSNIWSCLQSGFAFANLLVASV